MGTPGPRGLVLVVDPDPTGRLALDRQLERLGYDVVCVNQDEEALRAVTLGLRPDVLVLASRLPEGAGLPLVEALRRVVPHLRSVVVDSQQVPVAPGGMHPPAPRLVGMGGTVVVGPWSHDRLADALALALLPGPPAGQPR